MKGWLEVRLFYPAYKIKCQYREMCNRYSDNCQFCKNNTYIDPETFKKNYYKPTKHKIIMNIIFGLLVLLFIGAFVVCCIMG